MPKDIEKNDESNIQPDQDNTLKSTFSMDSNELKKEVKNRDGNKGRKILLGLCALVLLAGVVWGLTALTKTIINYVQQDSQHVLLSKRAQDEVESLHILTKDGTELTLTRKGATFYSEQITQAVLSQASCQSAFINAGELLTESVAAENVTDLAGFGLETPASVVEIAYSDGEGLVLEIGDRAPTSNLYYCKVAGEDTVYLMKGMLVDLFAGGINSFWDIEAFEIDTQMAVALTLEREGEQTLHLEYQGKPQGFRFSQWHMLQPFIADTNTQSAEAILGAISGIELTRFVDTTTELAQFGLDAPAQTFTLLNEDGTKFILYLGARDARGDAYLRFGGSNDVYMASAESIAFLEQVKLPGLITDFANIHAITNLASLSVELDGKTVVYTLDKSGEETAFLKDGAKMDADAFKNAYQSINTVLWADLVDEGSVQGAEAVLTLRYLFDNGEEAVVEYLDYSVNNLALRKNGSVGVAVRKDAVAQMLAALRGIA